MSLYAGMDLHSRNTYIGIIDHKTMKRVYQKRHINDLTSTLNALEPLNLSSCQEVKYHRPITYKTKIHHIIVSKREYKR